MGTAESKELQENIKSTLKSMSWSQKRLATEIYEQDSECENEEDLKRFVESFKKKLNRPSTSSEELERYLRILSQQDDFQKANLVISQYISAGALSLFIQQGMKEISQEIQKNLDQDHDV